MAADREGQMRRLLEVGQTLGAGLDPEGTLYRVLEAARDITGARYAALGVLNEDRTELERFITSGLDDETRAAIGQLPRGRGLLGVLIRDPRPLRLSAVGEHAASFGFPHGHPVMESFLGVPVAVRGAVWGNLYLTDKDGGPFDEADEEAAVLLAGWAGTAIGNARLFETSDRRRTELERAVRNLEATRDLADAVSGETGLDRVLELIVKRGRALVGARSAQLALERGEEPAVVARAGHPVDPARAGRAPGEDTMAVPLAHRGRTLAVLTVFDRAGDGGAFDEGDERLLRAFAASAANALAVVRSVETDRLRTSVAAADAERRRWARELNEETLRGLGAVRLLLAAALRRGDPGTVVEAARTAVSQLDRELEGVRGLIADMRPAALDLLGLRAALDGLVERHRASGAFEVNAELRLPERPLGSQLETTIYRVVHEALGNAAAHAGARSVRVAVTAEGDALAIEVADDGGGFDPAAATQGFGLAAMRERVQLAAGTLELRSGPQGTVVRARLPVAAGGSGLEQAAS